MILADSSIWIDHFKLPNLRLSRAISEQMLIMHPFVVGELALGSLGGRLKAIATFNDYEKAPVAKHDEVMALIELRRLFSKGLGYVDAHLLASCLIVGDCKLLTRDRRLREAAERLALAA